MRAAMGDVQGLMDRWVAAWNAHDEDAMAACLSEDVLYVDPGAYPDPVMRGPEAVKEFARRLWRSSPDLSFEVVELFVSDDERVVTMHWRTRGTFTEELDPPGFAPTGAEIAMEGYDRNEVRDGVSVKHEAFYDQFALGSQIGAIPPRGSFGEKVGRFFQRLAARRMRRKRG